ncbi:MAG: hypothetical protein WC348_01795 [Patescibacteria group bacterium]|jgi:DNA-binding ferritin-like protein
MKEPIKELANVENIKEDLIKEFERSLNEFKKKVDCFIYPLIIPPLNSIDEDVLFEVFPDLKKIGKQKRLHVLLYSYGGDAHTAFHIGRLLQDYATEELYIYILREAKSAATLLASSADKIIFSEISELGPMDPQIKDSEGGERFSPLAIKHVMDFLSDESRKGHSELVKTLAAKLPTTLQLGEHLKSLETGKDYLFKLLKTRMFKEDSDEIVQKIAEKLVTGYPDHGYCIDFKEALEIGLKVEKVDPKIENELFSVMENYKKVWDTFEKLIRDAKNRDDQKIKDAMKLLKGIRTVATNIIEGEIKENLEPKNQGSTELIEQR